MVNLKSLRLPLIGLILLIGCGTEPTPVYTLNTSVNGEGEIGYSVGDEEKITISSGEEQFDKGESITLTALPDSGWVFSSWGDEVTSTSNPITFTMDGDKSYISNFERKDYPLNITIIGEGSVSEKIVPIVQPKTTDYPYQTVVELTPIPTQEWDSWEFKEWGGDITSNTEVIEVPINGETNISVTFSYTGDGTRDTYLYDVNGNLIEEKRFVIKNEENVLFKTYNYDSNNNLIEETWFDSGGGIIVRRDTYEFDSDNNMTKHMKYGSDGNLMSGLRFYYDSNNNLVRKNEYDRMDELTGYYTLYSYDSKNRLIGETRELSGIWTISSIVYRYDSNNNLIYKGTSNRNGSGNRSRYEYNIDNLVIREDVYNTDDILVGTITNEYDSNLNVVKIEYRYSGQDTYGVTYDYLYDSENNITEQVETWSYGHKTRIKYSYDSDGNVVEVLTYVYFG